MGTIIVSYKVWVYCKNCGSNHFQLIETKKTLSEAPCKKCGVNALKQSAKNPADYGFRKSIDGKRWF